MSKDKEFYPILLRLFYDKETDNEFRKFLDNLAKNGIDRKQAILKMYEFYKQSKKLTEDIFNGKG